VAELAVDLVPFGPDRRSAASAEKVLRVMDVAAQTRGEQSRLPELKATALSTPMQAASRPGVAPAEISAPGPQETLGEFAHSAVTSPQRGRLIGIGIVVVLLLGGGLAIALMRGGDPSTPEAVVAEQPAPETDTAKVQGLVEPGTSGEPELADVERKPPQQQPAAPAPEAGKTENGAALDKPAPDNASADAPRESSATLSAPAPKPAPRPAPKPAPKPSVKPSDSQAKSPSTPRNTRDAFGGRL
jgi:hypothetical protein